MQTKFRTIFRKWKRFLKRTDLAYTWTLVLLSCSKLNWINMIFQFRFNLIQHVYFLPQQNICKLYQNVVRINAFSAQHVTHCELILSFKARIILSCSKVFYFEIFVKASGDGEGRPAYFRYPTWLEQRERNWILIQ